MRKIVVVLLAFVFSTAYSQFYVEWSNIQNGQAGVKAYPDTALLEIKFSKPIKQATFQMEFLPFLAGFMGPMDSIYAIIPDPSMITQTSIDTYKVKLVLAKNTDFTFVITGAISSTNDTLDSVFVLNFSTAPSPGPYMISGTINLPASKISNVPGFTKLNIPLNLKFNFQPTPPETKAVNPAKGIVALLENNPLAAPDAIPIFRYSGKVKSDFSYAVNYVRSGTYYLFAAFDKNNDGVIDPATGDIVMYYDQNGDGQPDSIQVTGNLTGINIGGQFQISSFTVREKLDTVKSVALTYASDAKLVGIEAFEGAPFDTSFDGRFYFTRYIFKSATKGYFAYAASPFGVSLDSAEARPTRELPATFLDSDSIFKIAEANGGSSFRNKYKFISISYRLMNFAGVKKDAPNPPDTTNIYWLVGYIGFTKPPSDTEFVSPSEIFAMYIDPNTGNVVHKVKLALEPVTAQGRFMEIDSLAKTVATDAKLVAVAGFEDTTVDGKSLFWVYLYRSKTLFKKDFGVVVFFGIPGIDTTGIFTYMLEQFRLSIPVDTLTNYIDSDSAMMVAEGNGGSSFRASNPHVQISMLLAQGSSNLQQFILGNPALLDTSRIYWFITYEDTVSRNRFTVVINAKKGSVDTTITKVEITKLAGVPEKFVLKQNYPNPFNPSTTIEYEIPARVHVKLEVFDILGRKIATLVNSVQEPGRYKVKFTASDLPSGIYLYRLKAGDFVKVKKMVLVK